MKQLVSRRETKSFMLGNKSFDQGKEHLIP